MSHILGTYYLTRHGAGYTDEQDLGPVHKEETNKFPFDVQPRISYITRRCFPLDIRR